MKTEKHSMIVLLDQTRAEVYKECAKDQQKNVSAWVRAVLDQACRKAGKEPEQWLEKNVSFTTQE